MSENVWRRNVHPFNARLIQYRTGPAVDVNLYPHERARALSIAGKIAVFGTLFGAIAIAVSVIWMTPLPLFIAGALFAISATALKVAEKWHLTADDQNRYDVDKGSSNPS